MAKAGLDIPDFDCGVCITRHEYVVLEFHATGQGLVTNQRVQALTTLHLPHADRRVERAAYDVTAVKLTARQHNLMIDQPARTVFVSNSMT